MATGTLFVLLALSIAAQSLADTPNPPSNWIPAGTDTESSTPPDSQAGQLDPKKWDLDIYPILAWLPIFGANVDLPSLPEGPGGGGTNTPGGSGSVSGSFNYAVFVGLSFRYDKWIADFSGVWAGLSAERTLPRVAISTQIAFGDLLAGRQIYRHVSLTGGVRRMGLRISAQVENSGERTWRPGFWDPLIGLDWRNRLSRKWTAQVSVDGGGFGVGSEVDFSARAHADWRFARHFGVLMGYGILHFQDSETVLGRTYKTKQTLNGPIFGFGIYL